jgi:SNF2 family DNA or RNA helicase
LFLQILRPFMLRRLKESVATELPTKLERVVHCGMSPYQAALQELVGGWGLGSGTWWQLSWAMCMSAPGTHCTCNFWLPPPLGTQVRQRLTATEAPGGQEVSTTQSDAAQKLRNKLGNGEDSKQLATSVNNTLMELRKISNHPLLSLLHPPHSEELVAASVTGSSLPPLITLCGKLDALDRLLLAIKKRGSKVIMMRFLILPSPAGPLATSTSLACFLSNRPTCCCYCPHRC